MDIRVIIPNLIHQPIVLDLGPLKLGGRQLSRFSTYQALLT